MHFWKNCLKKKRYIIFNLKWNTVQGGFLTNYYFYVSKISYVLRYFICNNKLCKWNFKELFLILYVQALRNKTYRVSKMWQEKSDISTWHTVLAIKGKGKLLRFNEINDYAPVSVLAKRSIHSNEFRELFLVILCTIYVSLRSVRWGISSQIFSYLRTNY